MTILGHYRWWDVFLRTSAFVVILLLLCALTIFGPNGDRNVEHYLADRPLLAPLLLLFWFGAPFALLFAAVIFKRLIFDGGRALWIENEHVVFLHRWDFSGSCKEIVEISVGTSGRFSRESIFLKMRNGTTKVITTSSLVEPRSSIVEKLKAHTSVS